MTAAPEQMAGGAARDLALLSVMDQRDVASFADVGGTARALALAAHGRWDCDIVLIDLRRNGRWPDAPSDWVAEYRDWLVAREVPTDRIRVIGSAAALRPLDVIVTLNRFGDRAKIAALAPVLAGALHSDTRLYLDIRKGSGAFPYLKAFGTTDILSESEGGDLRRVMLTPLPPAEAADESWPQIARELAGPDGFYTEGNGHSFLFVPRDPKVLVVTFDNLDIAMGKRHSRRPWGFEFIEKQGWSMLGVMAAGWTWYRDPFPLAEFARLRDEGFFARFDRVVFYGASMGGYAAAVFSAACPGADVVAISPQSTLDRAVVPWETRYKTAWDRDFSGPFGDAATASTAARQVTILFDPYEPLDAAHAARFTGANVVKLRCPLLGHRLGSSLSQMGILTPIILSALDGSLTPPDFYRRLRARRDFPRYQKELFHRAVSRGHLDLARRLGRFVLARGDNRIIRMGLKEIGG